MFLCSVFNDNYVSVGVESRSTSRSLGMVWIPGLDIMSASTSFPRVVIRAYEQVLLRVCCVLLVCDKEIGILHEIVTFCW